MTDESTGIVTIPEAARVLGISPRHAYELARQGQLPGAFRLGHTWKVSIIKLARIVHGEAS